MERIRHHGSIGRLARLIAAALLAMATMTASTANVMAADGSDWRVSDIKGDAQVKTGGAWRTLKRGDMVEPGSQVKTGAAGRVILVRPGDSLDIAPDGEFKVPKAANAGNGRPVTHISQSRGTILFKITTRPENPFTVETPYLAAVIKGTTFAVSVERDGAALHVSKGAVQVTSVLTGQTVRVGPGQTAAVNARDGSAMRLIGFEKSDAGGGASGAASPAAAGLGKAVRSTITTVIPRTVGVTDVNIGELSNGLVNQPSATVNGHGKGGKAGSGDGVTGKTARLGKGIAVAPGLGNPVPATYRAGQGNGSANGIGNGHANGIGNGNGNANGNGSGGKGKGKGKH
jgi:hypothetical protein